MVIRFNKDKTYSIWEKIAVALVALSPILQHYKGIVVYSGLIALMLPMGYAAIRMIKGTVIPMKTLAIVVPLIPYYIFRLLDHGITFYKLTYVMLLLLYALVFIAGLMSSKLFIKIAISVSCVASVLIIIQYICYYVLGFHLRLVYTPLLLGNASQWIKLTQTGHIGISGKYSPLYRPSSFFLEPAHMFVYLFPCLFYELLHPDVEERGKKKAILLSIGIVFSTSGMGCLVVAMAWMLYFAKRGGKNNRVSIMKLLRPRNIVLVTLLAAFVTFLYFRVSFIRDNFGRIINSSERESAISGRTAKGGELIGQLQGWRLFFGIADSYAEEIEFHMSGFNGSMYRYGIIGTILSYGFYIKSLFSLKNQYFWIAFVVIAISFFSAHSHTTFYMLYFMIFLIDGYHANNSQKICWERLRLSKALSS